MKQILNLSLWVACLAAWPQAVPAETKAAPAVVVSADFLTRLVEEMRTNNPALRSAAALTNAAAAGVAAVRTWEDPMLLAGGVGASKSMREDEGDVIYGLEQKLPLFGKPGVERKMARAESARESASLDYQFQQMRLALAKASLRAALASHVVSVSEKDLAWLGLLEQSLQRYARAGKASLVDILQIQNEQARLSTQLQNERNQLDIEKISLNRLLNRDEQSPWPELELPPLAGEVSYQPRLVEFALKYEPKTAVQQQEVKQAEVRVESARLQRYPDVTAGLEMRNFSGDGSFRQGMLTFRMNLPWWNHGKISADVRRENARLASAQYALASERQGIREELHQLTTKIDAARRDALLYRDQIVPRTETTLESVSTGWQSGQNTFREVLETHRLLLDARLSYARAVAEQYQMLSELVLCCGLGDLSALQMIGVTPEISPDTPPSTPPKQP